MLDAIICILQMRKGLPRWWCSVMNPHAMQETWVQSLGWEESPGAGHINPLLYSCLENPMDRGAWWATVHGVEKSQTQLSTRVRVCLCLHPQTCTHTQMRKLNLEVTCPRSLGGGRRKVWIPPVWFHSPCSELTLKCTEDQGSVFFP